MTTKTNPFRKYLDELEFAETQRAIGDMDRERSVRNQERDVAHAAGYTGEAYWETLPLEVLEVEQRKYRDSQ